ncbi:hypothetical protein GJ744_001211 [Endocarpon pusillum]|uniref:Uncharacterized protein n=1 Tax=Endocarpon pusillum TaxID=364733 RepID=A0A8H7AHB5_9EURO|nr:hypothetical protein GJ744_001211 [Endocarpon pusillum]
MLSGSAARAILVSSSTRFDVSVNVDEGPKTCGDEEAKWSRMLIVEDDRWCLGVLKD